MRKLVPKIVVFVGAASMAFVMVFLSVPAHAEKSPAKTNFEPSKRSMSFIRFMNAPENHGVRDMRSLKKRYARYRGGRFLVSDDTPAVDGGAIIRKKG